MKNAIFINDLRNGGAERVVSKIINRKDNESLLIQIWPEQFNKVICEQSFVLLKKKGFIVFDLLKASLALYKLIKHENIKTINSHLFWANYLNIFVSLFTKHITIPTHCVSFVSKFQSQKTVGFFHRCISSFLFKKSDNHIYKSYDMKKEYETLFKLKRGNVIYNPMNTQNVIELSKESVDFDFDPGKKYLLCVGRFHPTKKQSRLIKALAHLPVEYEIIFLGSGSAMAECECLALDLNVRDRSHFLGQRSNPYPFYSNSDLYLSASQSEGFPNALVEAIALECYPIHSDCPTGPKEILSLSYTNKPIKEHTDFSVFGLGTLLKSCEPKNIADAIQYKFLSDSVISNEQRSEFLSLVESEYIFNLYKSVFNKSFNNA